MCQRSSTNQLTLDVSSVSRPLLNYNNKATKLSNKKILDTNKNVLFKNSWLYWINLLKRMETRLYPRRPQPVRPSLPFKIIYTNIVDFKITDACGTTKSTIMVYLILNVKVVKPVLVYMGTVLISFFYDRSIQYIYIFF